MNINIKDVLKLENGSRYVVVSKANYQNREYLYLVNINNSNNIKFCYINNDELIESENKGLNTMLLPLFYNNIKV